ncbi:hypothetical protein FBU30_005151 [Linnemannia zychae]|nr:hypothetical protein FBU30_005151 [Linnemannia zychae]
MNAPAYTNACLTLAAKNPNFQLYLVGGSLTTQNLLEMKTISFNNYETLTTAAPRDFLKPTLNNQVWSNTAPLGCFNFPGNAYSALHVQQFGPSTSFGFNTSPINGLAIQEFPSALMSNKNFAVVGTYGNYAWVAALTNTPANGTNSNWSGYLFNSTVFSSGDDNSTFINFPFDMAQKTFPTNTPLLSVGTYTQGSTLPARGHLTVFDSEGSRGSVYSSTATTANSKFLNLSYADNVSMNSIVLTPKAIPVSGGEVGYILDQAPDGSSIIYSITPGLSTTLSLVPAVGNVASLTSSIAATFYEDQIYVFITNNGTSRFNAFNVTSNTWKGQQLVAPYGTVVDNPTESSKKAPVGAIVGGVVGGLVILALVAFLNIRYRRKGRSQSKASSPADSYTETFGKPVESPLQKLLRKKQSQNIQQSPEMQQQILHQQLQQQKEEQLRKRLQEEDEQQQRQQYQDELMRQRQEELLRQRQQEEQLQQRQQEEQLRKRQQEEQLRQQQQQQQRRYQEETWVPQSQAPTQEFLSPYTPVPHQNTAFLQTPMMPYSPNPSQPSPTIPEHFNQIHGYIYVPPPPAIPHYYQQNSMNFQAQAAQSESGSSSADTQATYVPTSTQPHYTNGNGNGARAL